MFCGLGLQNCYYDTQFTEQQSQLLAKTFFFLLKKKKKWTGAETIRAQPAGLITVLRNYGSCTPKLQSNSVSS